MVELVPGYPEIRATPRPAANATAGAWYLPCSSPGARTRPAGSIVGPAGTRPAAQPASTTAADIAAASLFTGFTGHLPGRRPALKTPALAPRLRPTMSHIGRCPRPCLYPPPDRHAPLPQTDADELTVIPKRRIWRACPKIVAAADAAQIVYSAR